MVRYVLKCYKGLATYILGFDSKEEMEKEKSELNRQGWRCSIISTAPTPPTPTTGAPVTEKDVIAKALGIPPKNVKTYTERGVLVVEIHYGTKGAFLDWILENAKKLEELGFKRPWIYVDEKGNLALKATK